MKISFKGFWAKLKKNKTAFLNKYVKPFFFANFIGSEGSMKPPYFWSTMFLFLTLLMVVLQIMFVVDSVNTGSELQTDLIPLIGIMGGLVIGLMAVYNKGKEEKDQSKKSESGKKSKTRSTKKRNT